MLFFRKRDQNNLKKGKMVLTCRAIPQISPEYPLIKFNTPYSNMSQNMMDNLIKKIKEKNKLMPKFFFRKKGVPVFFLLLWLCHKKENDCEYHGGSIICIAVILVFLYSDDFGIKSATSSQ